MIVDNRVDVNKNVLKALQSVVTKTVDNILSSTSDGLFIDIKSVKDLDNFTSDIRSILTDKIRKKINL